jgi:hypothetical protein
MCTLQAESDAAPLQLVVQVYEVSSSSVQATDNIDNVCDKLLGTATLQLQQVLQAAETGAEISCQLQLQQQSGSATAVKRVTLKVVTPAGPPLQRLRALREDMKVTLYTVTVLLSHSSFDVFNAQC